MSDDPRLESETKEDAYLDRNLAVLALLKMAHAPPRKVGKGVEKDGWVPLYLELPEGQVSWHLPVALVKEIFPLYEEMDLIEWDGHDVGEKRERLRRFVRKL